MKKILLNVTACLSLFSFVAKAQTVPCATYEMQEHYKKTIPGYAEKVQAAKSQLANEYQAFLQNKSNSQASRTSTLSPSYQFTVPVVFHILHTNGTENISDALCVSALAQVNKDYARDNADTNLIDPYFKPMYVNSNLHFELAKKDPYGNCTNGIVHHYDPNTNWGRDLYAYVYSTYGTYNWAPSKYLNIYIVKQIGQVSSGGITVGYTYIPGTSPNYGSDAIVYRHDFLSGLDARSLSHEIGHWFGLSHTFGDTNNPGVDCGDDGIDDTPKTVGFFSTCPKAGVIGAPPAVTTPNGTDIGFVKLGSALSMTTTNNSLTGSTPYTSGSGTVSVTKTITTTAKGTAGSYSDFTDIYPITYSTGNQLLTVSTLQSTPSLNAIRVYIDLNKNGTFDASESVLNQTTPVMGPQTATATVNLSASGLCRMRVIVNEGGPVTGPNMAITDGEYEDYMLNIGLAICDTVRPNIENIMDYSSCPKMFTQGQTDLMRLVAGSSLASRNNLSDTANLVLTGIFSHSVNPVTNATVYYPSPANVCAPISDFASNKKNICAGQSINYTATSYNTSSALSYVWTFEGGSPATSTNAAQTVTYSTPGVYGVTLTTTSAEGTSSKTEVSYVHVYWNSDPITVPFMEDFENGINWPDWLVVNPDVNSITWQSANYGSRGSSKCIMIPNAVGNPTYGQLDIIESKAYDFSNVSNVSLAFDYAFARKTAAVADTFKLQYSLDCGGSWINVLTTPTAAQMASASGGSLTTNPYVPIPADSTNWITKTYLPIATNVFNGKRDVKFRFYFRSDASGLSQNIFIDRLNITGVVGLNELAKTIGLAIYPNPTNSSASIDFTSPVDSKVTISVLDVTGRIVEQNYINASAGEKTIYTVNKNSVLTSGIYFVTLDMNGQKVTNKLIVE